MYRRRIYSFSALVVVLFSTWVFSDSSEKSEQFSEIVKISLREAGNQLLLSNQDSTSLILPITEIEESKYQLTFQNPLSFKPGTLVSVVKNSFHKSALPKYYRVAVMQCADQEVAYSYEIKNESENDIIPCSGRFLPKGCYNIDVRFTNRAPSVFNKTTFFYALAILAFISLQFVFYKREKGIQREGNTNGVYSPIGKFQFYPAQNKLVRGATEINISNKESELLVIFSANLNQVVTREELTKKVWEDKGVFVGRSLDTYISKLRKHLKSDNSVKLSNVHGVGYKLEITD